MSPTPEQFRKKPVVIQAMQYTEDSRPAVIEWLGDKCRHKGMDEDGSIYDLANISIVTLEGDMRAIFGDWIIKGVKGEFYPCKPDIFAATYEPAISPPSAAAVPSERLEEAIAHICNWFTYNNDHWKSTLGDLIRANVGPLLMGFTAAAQPKAPSPTPGEAELRSTFDAILDVRFGPASDAARDHTLDELVKAALAARGSGQWTKEKPTKTGSYWYGWEQNERPSLMFVEKLDGENECGESCWYLVVVDEYGEEDGPLEDYDGWWMPADVPPLPAEPGKAGA